MQETEFQLKGSELFVTCQAQQAYRVQEGHVLVFILPLHQDRPGRRLFLREALPGEVIPALCCSLPVEPGEEPCGWAFGLVALDTASLTPMPGSREITETFAQGAALRDWQEIGFDEAVVETYRLNMTRELRNLYTAEEERTGTYSKSLEIIYRLFYKRDQSGNQAKDLTGNYLYDAAARICAFQHIELAPLELIRSSCGRRFEVRDVARLSHFTCRDVILEEDWFRQDSGPILARYQQNGHWVACLPKGPSHYLLWDPSDSSTRPLTRELAAQLMPQAQMFYRPLPQKSITMWDLVKFGVQDIYKRDVVNILLFALLGTMVGLMVPYLNELLYDMFIPLGDVSGLRGICSVVLACTVGNICFMVVKNLASFRALNRMKYALQAAVYDRLFNLPESFFRGYDSADLAQRAVGISVAFQMLAATAISVVLGALFSLMYLWRMFSYSPRLSVVMLLMLLAAMLLIGWWGWRQLRYETAKVDLEGDLFSMLYQLLGGVEKIRMAGVENRALYEYLKLYTKSRGIDMKRDLYTRWAGVLTTAMMGLFTLVLYSMMIGQTTLSVGAFMGFTTAFGALSAAMLDVVNNILNLNGIIPAVGCMKPIFETLPERDDDTTLPGDLEGEIEVDNLTFAYDKDSDPVLHDISLHIKPGEYVGIVGSSGCGKSTLLKLLLGFEKPDSGRIYYDGRDIDTIDKRELRKKFGVILQDSSLIAGSVYENITITNPNVPMSRVQEAVRSAGLEQDLAEMPMGLHTLLSEGGNSVSGGQRQRVMIARAIVNKPRILFFDEATSALDNATQATVCDSLEKLKTTRVVIAHRLSTIMKCDRILVMDEGRLVEQGSYQDLMDLQGHFYQLASRQIY